MPDSEPKIIVLHRVLGHMYVAEPGVYTPHLNPYGAVSVDVPGGRLGLKPDEFEWINKPDTWLGKK